MAEWPSIKISDFTRGYIDKIDENQLPEGALKDCRNVISRQIGRISSRRGQARLNDTEINNGYGVHGLHPFYLGNTKYLLVAVNGSVYYCTPPDGEMILLKTDLDPEAPIKFVTAFVDGENQVMGFNGVNTPWKWNGTTVSDMNDYRSVTRETPTTNDYITYTLAHKPVRAGSDKFFVFSNNDAIDFEDGYVLNAEEGAIVFSAAKINNVTPYTHEDAVTVVYPLNGRIEALHPFREGCTVVVYDKDGVQLKTFEDETELGGWKADYSNGVIAAPLSLDYIGRTPFYVTYEWTDVIKVDYQYSNGNLSSQFKLPAINKGRIFVMAGDEHIYWSDITENGSEYESWPPVNNWPVNQGSGELDGCLQILSSELYVFLSRSIHRFRGNDLEDFRLEQVVSGVGCTGPLAATTDNNGDLIYFVSEQGLYSFNGVTATNLSRDHIPILWETINVPALQQAAVKVWHGLVLFALPTGTNTTNNIVIVYDPATQAFWPWDSMEIAMWADISTTSGTKLYSGKTAEGYVLEQDVGDDDEGAGIISYFKLPTLDLGEPDMLKKARYVYVEHGENSVTWAETLVSKDYEQEIEIAAVKADGAMRKYVLRPTITGKWRYLGLCFRHFQAGPFEVRSVKVPYKIKQKSSVKGELT